MAIASGALIAGLLSAGTAVAGDVMAQQGQEATNAMSLSQNQQIMNWETQMSDTAMSRRMVDLKSAGLNPILAVGQGGASTPGAGPVALGNPESSFGGLGGQISNAMSAANQTATTMAQVKNIDADTQSKVLDNKLKDPEYSFGDSGSMGAAKLDLAVSQASSAAEAFKQIQIQNKTLEYQLDNILPTQSAILGLDRQKATEVLPYAVDLAKQQAKLLDLGVPEAQAKANYFSGPIGKYDPAIGRALEAVGVAGGLFGLARMFTKGMSSAVSGGRAVGAGTPLGGQAPGLNPSGSDRLGNIDQYLGGD